MAVPNVNQHYDLIVIKNWNGPKTDKADIAAGTANPGDVIFFANSNGEGRFMYRDNDTLKSSVLMNAGVFSQFQSKTRVRATDTKYQRKTVIIKPKSTLFDGNGKVQSTDVASVYLTFKNFLVLGDYNTYIKDGYVQLNRNMSKGQMLFELAKTLIRSMKRDVNLGIKIFLSKADSSKNAGYDDSTGNNATGAVVTQAQIEAAGSYSDVTLTGIDCLVIQEDTKKWDLGRFYFERTSFDVSTNLIDAGSVGDTFEQKWAEDVTDLTYHDKSGVPNGRMVAEIEYASQAQRGDFWGRGGYPYTFHADGLVDPTKEYDIAILDITYRGDAEDVQYSPKQLFLVMEKENSNATPLTAVLTAINNYLK